MNNFIIIVLDGVGVGELPDAKVFDDVGCNTLANIDKKVGGLNLPNLEKLGLGNIFDFLGVKSVKNPLASFGKMNEQSNGKDSTIGHWEIGGLNIQKPFPVYPSGFSNKIIDSFIDVADIPGILGNKAASGTQIIKELGEEHIKTKKPIVYTSADSVFQIAAHEQYFGLDKLYDICKIARSKIFINENAVARIIARPFVGEVGTFTRTTNRKDYSVIPPNKTILNYLSDAGINTIAIGKINDLFNYSGINNSIVSKSNDEGVRKIIDCVKNNSNSFIFANLVDFDVNYGHRNDPVGFHNTLRNFDSQITEIINSLNNTDRLILTADHGNDPTTKGTDHSREYVPLLYFSKNRKGVDLGIRSTFADIAQTAAHHFKINNTLNGESFLNS